MIFSFATVTDPNFPLIYAIFYNFINPSLLNSQLPLPAFLIPIILNLDSPSQEGLRCPVVILMSRNKIGKESRRKDIMPSFRSVGHVPCDFHRLKYTTSYRNFTRNPNAAEQPIELKLKLPLQLTQLYSMEERQEKQRQEAGGRKQKGVDKWKEKHKMDKEKYKRSEEEQYFERRRSYEYLPGIQKNQADFHDRFKITRYAAPAKPKLGFPQLRVQKPLQPIDSFKPALFRARELPEVSNSAAQLRRTYSLTVKQQAIKSHVKNSKSSVRELNQVEQMPAGWEINEEEEWLGKIPELGYAKNTE